MNPSYWYDFTSLLKRYYMKTIIGILLSALTLPAFAQEQKSLPVTNIQLKDINCKSPVQSTIYVLDCIVPFQPVQLPVFNFFAPTFYVLTREDIERLPYNNINDMISLFPGVYQRQRGADVHIFGSR